MAEAISLKFPDGSERSFDAAISGAELAAGISKSLAKKAIAYALDGVVRDLADAVGHSGTLEILTRDDPRALELIRHDAAHVMAEAVQELYPGTQVTFGPATEDGFYYDFARAEPFTSEDLEAIEAHRFVDLPPEPYLSNHVKSYAEALGIRAAEALAERYAETARESRLTRPRGLLARLCGAPGIEVLPRRAGS